MGLSFSGPGAPPPRRPRLLSRRRLHSAGRYILAAALACAVTALGATAMFLTTGPPWLSYALEPFSFLLLPGFILEGIPRNPGFFTPQGVLYYNGAIYTVFFAFLLRRNPRSTSTS